MPTPWSKILIYDTNAAGNHLHAILTCTNCTVLLDCLNHMTLINNTCLFCGMTNYNGIAFMPTTAAATTTIIIIAHPFTKLKQNEDKKKKNNDSVMCIFMVQISPWVLYNVLPWYWSTLFYNFSGEKSAHLLQLYIQSLIIMAYQVPNTAR